MAEHEAHPDGQSLNVTVNLRLSQEFLSQIYC